MLRKKGQDLQAAALHIILRLHVMSCNLRCLSSIHQCDEHFPVCIHTHIYVYIYISYTYICLYNDIFDIIYIVHNKHMQSYAVSVFLHATYNLHTSSNSDSSLLWLENYQCSLPCSPHLCITFLQSFPEKNSAHFGMTPARHGSESANPKGQQAPEPNQGDWGATKYCTFRRLRLAWPRSSSISTTHCNSPRISASEALSSDTRNGWLPNNYRHIYHTYDWNIL